MICDPYICRIIILESMLFAKIYGDFFVKYKGALLYVITSALSHMQQILDHTYP
mgnify:CR=1 FL=1